MTMVAEVRRNGRRMSDGQLHQIRMRERAQLKKQEEAVIEEARVFAKKSILSMVCGPNSAEIESLLESKIFDKYPTPTHMIFKSLEVMEQKGINTKSPRNVIYVSYIRKRIEKMTNPNQFQPAEW